MKKNIIAWAWLFMFATAWWAYADLTSHVEATFDALLLALDSNANGQITDETWFSNFILQSEVDNTPVDGVTDEPISSGWAFGHENNADQHPEYLQKADNLSDLNNAATARTSLGLGTAAVRAAEDSLTDGANLPDGAAVKAYGDTNWGAAATTTTQGEVELSTDAESVTGTSDAVVVTPGTLTARLSAPGAIGGTTPNVVNATQIEIVRSGEAGDQWNFREGYTSGDNYTGIKGSNSQDSDNIFELFSKPNYTRLGPPYVNTIKTANHNAYGQYGQWDIIPFSGTDTAINLDAVSNLTSGMLIIHSLDAETKSIIPNASDYICYDASGTFACLDDGDTITVTDVGSLSMYRRKDGYGWNILDTDLAITDAGATGCSGWNCGIPLDSDCQAYYLFESGALTTDEQANWTLTSYGTPVADAVNYIEGAASVELEHDDDDRYVVTADSVDPFGWATSGDLSVTFWIRPESHAGSRAVLLKSYAIGILYASNQKILLRLDGNDDSSWEDYYHGSAMTDGQWYFVAITYNATSEFYSMHIWDQTASGTLGVNINEVTDEGIANMSDATAMVIAGNTGYTLDANLDEIAIFDRVLNQTEIDQIRGGTYGQ